jgi:ribonucleoside-triphosphate reductase (thioredoxin)
MMIREIVKRDGSLQSFDSGRIENAIRAAFQATGTTDCLMLMSDLAAAAIERLLSYGHEKPSVEDVSDAVEDVLMDKGYHKVAKAYILYREDRAKKRGRSVSPELKSLVEENSKFFQNQLGEFVYYRTYARWLEDKKRRETWSETVKRYMDYMKATLAKNRTPISDVEYDMVEWAILNHEVMPSMRLLQFAGVNVDRDNVCAYNCAYIAPTEPKDLAEILYVLMCGAGVGFSVEKVYVDKFPVVSPPHTAPWEYEDYEIEDSREGWANALRFGVERWFAGEDTNFKYSNIRPSGSRLKTTGGRASGPGPLKDMLEFTRDKILSRQGSKLRPIDLHDIICKIGSCVVAGGVRRTALISLSDLDDIEMQTAKSGNWFDSHGYRSLANNSACYNTKPDSVTFLREWLNLAESGSGERGIHNRSALDKHLPYRRLNQSGFVKSELGGNPCQEISLKSKQFCNLTEVICRSTDSAEDIKHKVRVASLLGTYQSMLTNFPYLSSTWKENCEQERLLGVSLTGIMDNSLMTASKFLEELKEVAFGTNLDYAQHFRINPSMAITCVKPSGTVSQLVNSSSGIHPRYSEYYIRRIRISATDPLFKLVKDQGVPCFPENGQFEGTATTYVLEFPVQSPEHSRTRKTVSAMDQLSVWNKLKQNYTEHNPSCTIYVGDDEWLEVGRWVYNNWDRVGGLSFFPKNKHIYSLAPYEEITKERYEELVSKFPKLDFSQLSLYETEDENDIKAEMACAGGLCEL